MLPLFFVAIVANASSEPAARIVTARPARATVRIVRGVEIRVSEISRFEESTTRKALVREPDGSEHLASLIEFY